METNRYPAWVYETLESLQQTPHNFRIVRGSELVGVDITDETAMKQLAKELDEGHTRVEKIIDVRTFCRIDLDLTPFRSTLTLRRVLETPTELVYTCDEISKRVIHSTPTPISGHTNFIAIQRGYRYAFDIEPLRDEDRDVYCGGIHVPNRPSPHQADLLIEWMKTTHHPWCFVEIKNATKPVTRNVGLVDKYLESIPLYESAGLTHQQAFRLSWYDGYWRGSWWSLGPWKETSSEARSVLKECLCRGYIRIVNITFH